MTIYFEIFIWEQNGKYRIFSNSIFLNCFFSINQLLKRNQVLKIVNFKGKINLHIIGYWSDKASRGNIVNMTFFLNGGSLEITSLVPLYFVYVEEKIRPYLYFVSVEEKIRPYLYFVSVEEKIRPYLYFVSVEEIIRPYFYGWVVQRNLFWREQINQHILICHQGLQW